MADTTYDVELRYGVEARGAEAGLGILAARAAQAERNAFSLRGALRTLGTLAGGVGAALGISKLGDALVGYNVRLEQTQITLQQIAAVNLHTSFEQAQAPVARYIALLREAARLSPGTQEEFLRAGQDVLGPVLRTRGSIEQARDLTRGLILAKGSAPTELASLDVQQALAGTVGKKDRFIAPLIEASGIAIKTFNQLLPEARLKRLLDIFNSPAILESAARYGRSWEGTLSTLRDTLQQLFGRIGLPLTQAITRELIRWNTLIERYQPELEVFAARAAAALVRGFQVARDGVGYIVAHKTELLALGAAFALRQGTGGVFNIAERTLTSLGSYQRQFASLQQGTSLKTLLGLGGAGTQAASAAGLLPGRQIATLYVGTLIAGTVSGAAPSGLAGLGGASEALAGAGAAGGGGRRLATARTVATLGVSALTGGLGGVAIAQATGRFAQLSPTLDKVNTVAGFVEGALSALPGPLGLVGTTATLVHQGLLGLYGYFERRKQAQAEENRVLGGARAAGTQFSQAQIFRAAEQVREAGAAKDTAATATALAELRRRTVPELLESKKFGEFIDQGEGHPVRFDYQRYGAALIAAGERAEQAELFAQRAAYAFETLAKLDPNKLRELFNLPEPEPPSKRRPELARPQVNITIHRLEVTADDPQRVAIGLARFGRDALRNPLSARSARPRGF